MRVLGLAVLLVGAGAQWASAALITYNPQDSTVAGAGFLGQSFSVPGSGGFDNIKFSWFANDAGLKSAAGNLFILNGLYNGSPDGLTGQGVGAMVGSAMSTILATAPATVLDGVYNFDPGFTLTGGTTYFAYMDGTLAATAKVETGTLYTGGQLLGNPAVSSTNYFSSGVDTSDIAFELDGIAVAAIPEPSSLALLGLCIAGLAAYRRRKSPRRTT